MKKLFAILLFLLAAPVSAQNTHSSYVDPEFTIKGKLVSVFITDKATTACWTNIGEVKRYAESKLSEAGAIVIKPKSMATSMLVRNTEFELDITLQAQRWEPTGWCYGHMSMNLTKPVIYNTEILIGFASKNSAQKVKRKNFNLEMLDWVDKHLKNYD